MGWLERYIGGDVGTDVALDRAKPFDRIRNAGVTFDWIEAKQQCSELVSRSRRSITCLTESKSA